MNASADFNTKSKSSIDFFAFDEPISVWSWNGYNSKWVEFAPTADAAREMADKDLANESGDTLTIQDGEWIAILVRNENEFYGNRVAVTVYTNKPGEFLQENPVDNLVGTWVWAEDLGTRALIEAEWEAWKTEGE